jgi:hypothetical protein
MQILLVRHTHYKSCTLGYLIVEGVRFATIERPWLNNRSNISCIPKGSYLTHYLAKSGSGKYKDTFHVTNVPGRSGILIHNGNLVDHTKGCILLGMKHGVLGGEQAVVQSKQAMREFNRVVDKRSFTLRVI